jgi:hypothetical protein
MQDGTGYVIVNKWLLIYHEMPDSLYELARRHPSKDTIRYQTDIITFFYFREHLCAGELPD